MTDINIRIHAVDQLIDLGKGILEKVILPPFEEVGLLLADQIKLFRLKNQVDILDKADKYLKQKNIKTKRVSTKVIATYLEDCSLEEDETLKDKWAALLVNTVKEESQIDNVLYSYILNQLSPKDANILETIFSAVIMESNNGPAKVLVHTHKMFFTSSITRKISGSDISIDNLIRLRLLKESGNHPEPFVVLTNLGFSFVINCTYPQ